MGEGSVESRAHRCLAFALLQIRIFLQGVGLRVIVFRIPHPEGPELVWESAMRNGWLIAAAIVGAANVSQGADLQIFGIHTPDQGKWAVYARISNANSVNGGGTQVSGMSGITLDMLNN